MATQLRKYENIISRKILNTSRREENREKTFRQKLNNVINNCYLKAEETKELIVGVNKLVSLTNVFKYLGFEYHTLYRTSSISNRK